MAKKELKDKKPKASPPKLEEMTPEQKKMADNA